MTAIIIYFYRFYPSSSSSSSWQRKGFACNPRVNQPFYMWNTAMMNAISLSLCFGDLFFCSNIFGLFVLLVCTKADGFVSLDMLPSSPLPSVTTITPPPVGSDRKRRFRHSVFVWSKKECGVERDRLPPMITWNGKGQTPTPRPYHEILSLTSYRYYRAPLSLQPLNKLCLKSNALKRNLRFYFLRVFA